MRLKTFRAGLIGGCTVCLASFGVNAPAQAVIAAPTAYIVESFGAYTVVNNSSFQVYRFIVSNPAANSESSAFTTQAGWLAIVCSGACPGAIQNGFLYLDSGVASDIGPGQTSGRFYFSAAPASAFEIDLRDADGGHSTVVTGTAVEVIPEPATWVLMTVGLGAAGTMTRRRRASGSAVVSA